MRYFAFSTLLVITIILLVKGTAGKRPTKIVGGGYAKIEDFPFMVALENGYTWQTCGAMLISPRHALTAAHCVVNGREENDPYRYELRWYNIVSGDSNRQNVDTVQVHKVVRLDVHKSFIGYPPPFVGDIAVITLDEPIKIGPTRRPAGLPSRRYGRGEHGVILGWGWTQPENGVSQRDLKKAPMTIDRDIDGYKFEGIEREGIAFCNGDSGGPFYINGEVYGIISHSIDCTGNTPGVFTNVYDYKDWIEQIVQGLHPSESAELRVK
ncbi:trypsin-like [Chelonus insularis]|uniref:trypsin-like n=1 Tax=Chelonus insularis TaxID=460826 RepID=UPI00158D583C|nr:trypsin-like [Chelonus insularis]